MSIVLDGTKGVSASGGLYAANTFTGTYTGGLVADFSGSTGRISVGSGNGITFYNNGIANNALAQIDSSGNLNFKQNNAGIVFQNSSALTNSTLNDYETGTFTPYLSASGYTFSHGSQVGTYTKIGNMVLFKIYITASYVSGSGSPQGNINGLPFNASSSTSNYGGISMCPDTGSAWLTTNNGGGYAMPVTRTTPGANLLPIILVGNSKNITTAITWSSMPNNTEFEISGHYQTTF